MESLPIEKRVAAAKWLEGTVIGQMLTPEEIDSIVNVVNKYINTLKKDEYSKGINALLDFLRKIQVQKNSDVIFFPT